MNNLLANMRLLLLAISIDYFGRQKRPCAFLNGRSNFPQQQDAIGTKVLLHLNHSAPWVENHNATASFGTFFGTIAGEMKAGNEVNQLYTSYDGEEHQSILSEAVSTSVNILQADPSRSNPFAPPVGAEYELNLRIPVIGPQVFQLKILSNTRGKLVVNGALQIDDEVEYSVDKSSGALSFTLSNGTKEVLRRFRTKLLSVNYCAKTDTPLVRVSPPLPVIIDLKLKRKNVIL